MRTRLSLLLSVHNLAANDAHVAWEKDQLERGQNQNRLKHVNENTSAKTSEILGKHDERERANKRIVFINVSLRDYLS